jgi:prepilin-type N-terminal cleavage/methylation domain-containing protein
MQRPFVFPRRGFTLLELIIAISVIALIMGLLLPAVQSARAAARLAQCKNNLKQLGLALNVYHDSNRCFPAGSLDGWSWIAQLLPELEQTGLQSKLNFRVQLQEAIQTGQNVTQTDIVIPTLLCPSDPRSAYNFVSPDLGGGKPFAHTNYLGTESSTDGKDNGMFDLQSCIRMRDVLDGTSQTLFVGERGVDRSSTNPGKFGWWILGAPFETFMSVSDGMQSSPTTDVQSVQTWWSNHPGGIAFCFVDGSVHFLNNAMGPTVFASLGTRAGGEMVTVP